MGNGPFKPGNYPDLMAFRENLKHELAISEKFIANNIYTDEQCASREIVRT